MALNTATARINFIQDLLTDDIRRGNVFQTFMDTSLQGGLANAISVPIPTMEIGADASVASGLSARNADWADPTGNTSSRRLLTADQQVTGKGRVDVLDMIEYSWDSVGPTIAAMRYEIDKVVNDNLVAFVKAYSSQASTVATVDKSKVTVHTLGDASNGIQLNGEAEGDGDDYGVDALEFYRQYAWNNNLWNVASGNPITGQGIPSEHVALVPFPVFRSMERQVRGSRRRIHWLDTTCRRTCEQAVS